MQWFFTFFDQHIWTWKVLLAIILVSPKIFSTIAASVVQVSIDRKVKSVNAARTRCLTDMSQLEQLTNTFEQHQMMRASFLMILNATNADLDWKLKIDRLYRLNARGTIRRALAVVHPTEWETHIRPYSELLNTDYSADKIGTLQEAENGFDQDARSKLTALQSELNSLSDRKEKLESNKTRISFVIDSVGWILTIVVFFVQHG